MSATCARCQHEVEGTATRCPECGYSPRRRARTVVLFGIVLGVLLTLTGIGAWLGVPLVIGSLLYAYLRRDITVEETL